MYSDYGSITAYPAEEKAPHRVISYFILYHVGNVFILWNESVTDCLHSNTTAFKRANRLCNLWHLLYISMGITIYRRYDCRQIFGYSQINYMGKPVTNHWSLYTGNTYGANLFWRPCFCCLWLRFLLWHR